MTICRYKAGRFWAVYDPAGALVCVCVYRKGAREVARRLHRQTRETPRSVRRKAEVREAREVREAPKVREVRP